MVAICLGALAPILGALHAASHETRVATVSPVCHQAPTAPTPDTPADHHPDKPAPRHECPICVLLTTALRNAAPPSPGPIAVAPAAERGEVVLTAAERPARPVRRPSQPRAPPSA